MAAPTGSSWRISLKINDLPDDYGHLVERFEWKSTINNGFIVRVKLIDPYFQLLDKIIEGRGGILETGRQPDPDKVTLIRFQIGWNNGIKTKVRVALLSDMYATGGAPAAGLFEIIAVDPISYFVNTGDCSGKAYRGKIGGAKPDAKKDGVIAQVLKEYLPQSIGRGDVTFNIKIKVDDTDDEPNIYYMMRQDPKTFIMSLLDWSCAFSKHKTAWIVTNGQSNDEEMEIYVGEHWNPSLGYPVDIEGDSGPYVLSYGGPESPPADIAKWEFLADAYIAALNTKIVTSGMSSATGLYCDKVADQQKLLKKNQQKAEEVVFVKDENTENKTNPKLDKKQSFAKPKEEEKGWTAIHAIPEITSSNDIGKKYSEYVSGKARQTYLDMLGLTMRMRLTCSGQPRLFDSAELGGKKVTLRWMRPAPESDSIEPRFMDGDWLLDGWHHKASAVTGVWETDVYVSRLDYDAKSNIG